jgi:S-DNA-T family DNA segregation ATPase FtsK/SpoIIIE
MSKSKKAEKRKEKRRTSFPVPKVSLNLSTETKRGIAVIIFLILAGIAVFSLLNIAGPFGALISQGLAVLFGVLSYLVPVFLLAIAVQLFRVKREQPDAENKGKSHMYARTYLGSILFVGALAGLIHIFLLRGGGDALALAGAGRGGGYLGALFAGPFYSFLGFFVGVLVLIGILVIGVLVTFNISLRSFLPRKTDNLVPAAVPAAAPQEVKINSMAGSGFTMEKVVLKNPKVQPPEQDEPPVKIPEVSKIAADSAKIDAIVLEDRKDWKLPPFDLLDDNKTEVDSGNIENNVAIIQKTLQDFGIDVEMGEVNVGPTVTQYTLRPAIGVKLSQIASLQNDLALALSAHSIRMELPIPGKPLVGIEVPNKSTAIVRLREVMQTNDFITHKSKLALALGRDVAGRPVLTDLAKMPHMLIAGATGTGKSVAINSLFISLLYRNTPQDVKFIVVDPKRVELNLYNGIPHLLTPVITDYEKAINALKWAVAEMDRRYKLLAESGKRNILEYNEANQLPVPYIVIIVDELADLMAVSQNDVEATIVRLAQMARAVGIHLVLATQRPSVDVITGLIKANITSRVAFAVASQIDSRTILDAGGAEKLLGNGDMLFVTAEFNKPRRVQGAFIGEKEVRKVVDFFKQQTGAVIYNEEIIDKPKKAGGVPGLPDGNDGGDELFDEARDVVTKAGKASASLLQRRLRIGYARAARLLDILEDQGIIGPGDGAKPREVYGVVPSGERAEYGIEDEGDIE